MALAHYFVCTGARYWCKNVSYLATLHQSHTNARHNELSHSLMRVHEKKFVLCWQQSLSCTACHYKSRMYKLYSEVNTGSRGQKPCAPNVAIHVGLQDTTTGNTKLRRNKHTSPKSKRDAKEIHPGCHNYFSVHD